ncbi:hypothetical protein BJQ94_05405 [Cryobacterium sp. SO2]|uniref:hypothetical protein n=1 Tax=Cryobacterium sp. SO2 TaxID=1897060 RepID=UPI00223D8FB3|nr:hypothetical protein [Cryobacterium sp. SO2]WEO78474.1 hypothetical protein BJQ94_05405 [Cryobacterium sp. SO2]
MTRTTTWDDFRARIVTQARENRIAFAMAVWLALVLVPTCVGLVMMLFIGLPHWLGLSMAVVAGLAAPPSLYFRLRGRSNIGIKLRPYRPEPVGRLTSADGNVQASSWRWPILTWTVVSAGAFTTATLFWLLDPPHPLLWGAALVMVGVAGAFLVGLTLMRPFAVRALARLQAGLELDYPGATFVIFKSAQVSSQIATADSESRLTWWNDNTTRAVVTFSTDGLRVWDQIWGERRNVAMIPWSRFDALGTAAARVRWRYVRGIDLSVVCQPGEQHIGVLLPPVEPNSYGRPMSDEGLRALSAQLTACLGNRTAVGAPVPTAIGLPLRHGHGDPQHNRRRTGERTGRA